MPNMRLSFLAATLVTGCASIPNTDIHYYGAAADVTLTILQTVQCDGQNVPHSEYSIVPSVKYRADLDSTPFSLPLAGSESRSAEKLGKVKFREDGRLAGINLDQTGQGSTALQAVVSAVTSVAPLVGLTAPTETERQSACTRIRAIKGDDPLTIKYIASAKYDSKTSTQGAINVVRANISNADYAVISRVLRPPRANLVLTEIHAGLRFPQLTKGTPADQYLAVKYNKLSILEASLELGLATEPTKTQTVQLVVPVPENGTNSIYVPKSGWFGASKFFATFAESGAPDEVSYTGTSGLSDSLKAVQIISGELSGKPASAKAADTKAEADLIYQQERLVRCQTNPATCPVQ